ncbi:lyase family protein [Photobacterium sp. TY1-4]|uniref:lyase family protein n=1 Tax=Photobacterium sp. TY1-4 TaxID=2899122 RepID=UPI0021BFFF99|nr:lyase family protein [Photobacterium sp. TY1-4]UXI03580.1 lyase family protein [Photobacterium sp. TY1-4]
MTFRTETDGIGPIPVPENALYGAQTQRALNLYPVAGQKTLGDYPALVKGLLAVKATAARVNRNHGELDAVLGMNIEIVCQSLMEDFSPALFPVHAFHGGGGISTNMNLNEVVANLVNSKFYNQPPGSYTPAHPNDHINLNHSTSDALQTACHLAARAEGLALIEAMHRLEHALKCLQRQHRGQQKIARTCLQDAVAIDFADFWGGMLASVESYRDKLARACDGLLAVNLGANIIGRAGDCSPAFAAECIEALNQTTSGHYTRHCNFYQCSQSLDAQVALAAEVENLAGFLIKMAKDIRLMASGPETGLAEIVLPAVQPGSSAMPGKVNPTIPEFMVQCAMQAIGHCTTVKLSHGHGELDYTPWGMLVITNLLDAVDHLTKGVAVFADQCVIGIRLHPETNQQNVDSLIPTVIELKKRMGYQQTSALVKQLNGDKVALKAHLASLMICE